MMTGSDMLDFAGKDMFDPLTDELFVDDCLYDAHGNVRISRWVDDGLPLLFQTMFSVKRDFVGSVEKYCMFRETNSGLERVPEVEPKYQLHNMISGIRKYFISLGERAEV